MRVQLVETGPSKIKVVKLLREYTGFDLRECSDIVSQVPCTFSVDMDQPQFQSLATDLWRVGAKLVRDDQAQMADFADAQQEMTSSPPPPPPEPAPESKPQPQRDTLPPPPPQVTEENTIPTPIDFPDIDLDTDINFDTPELPEIGSFEPNQTTLDVDFNLVVPDVPAFDFELPSIGDIETGEVSEDERKEERVEAAPPPMPEPPAEQPSYQEPEREPARNKNRSDDLSQDQRSRAMLVLKGRQRGFGAFFVGLVVAAALTFLWWIVASIDYDVTRYGIIIIPFLIAGTVRSVGRAYSAGFGFLCVILTAASLLLGILLRVSMLDAMNEGYAYPAYSLDILMTYSDYDMMNILSMHMGDSFFLAMFVAALFIAFVRGYKRAKPKDLRAALSLATVETDGSGRNDYQHVSHVTRGDDRNARREHEANHRHGAPLPADAPGARDRGDADMYERKRKRRKEFERTRTRKREGRRHRD